MNYLLIHFSYCSIASLVQAIEQYEKCKKDLENVASLFHLNPELPLSFCTDASNTAVGRAQSSQSESQVLVQFGAPPPCSQLTRIKIHIFAK